MAAGSALRAPEGPGASEDRGQRRAEGPADAAAVADVEVEAAGPLLVDGVSLSAGRSLALGLAVGVVAAVFLGPWVGVATAAVTAVALGLRRGQVLLRAACVGAFGLAAAFIVAKQLRADYVVDFEWMNNSDRRVGAVRRRSAGRRPARRGARRRRRS